MAFDQRNLDDYIDVAERMTEFYERYPEGSLRAADPRHPWQLAEVKGTKKDGTETTQTFIVYSALAYRHPADLAPGVGVAWEIWPGRTPYTLGSELMNAETSAWGRAMAALGIATKRGISSRQEVANRRAERDDQAAQAEYRAQRNAPPEVDEHGAATLAEQERMVTGPEPGAWRSTSTAENDRYYDNGKTPEQVHRDRMAQMFALFAKLGIKGNDDATKARMLADLSAMLDKPVTSRADLNLSELTTVCAILRRRAEQEEHAA